jgi:tetratricopeptide (TPR) repeat protein
MKFLKFIIIVSAAFIFSHNNIQAQTGRFGYGQDSIDCIKNLNFYQEDFKGKRYKSAYQFWREALHLCPQSSFNLYINGLTIMRDRIEGLTDTAQKQAAIDSLIMLYDKRIEYFPTVVKDKSDVLFRKANVIEEFYENDNRKIYDSYIAVIEIDKEKYDPVAAAKAIISAKKMYEANEIDVAEFTDIYSKLSDIIDERIKTINKVDAVDTVALKDAKTCKTTIENTFISTNAANCDNLISLFRPRFEANSEDIATVGLIVNILIKRECTNNDLFYETAEAYYKLDPSPKSASTLAMMFLSKGDSDKAIQYYKDAIDGQTDMSEKSQYQTTVANILLQKGQIGQAMSYANQAIASDSHNARAYFILAAVYASVKNCGDDPVSARSVFWAAVDVLQKAKQVESDPKFIDEINKQISLYRQYFPTYDDCFDRDILDGQTYNVNCGGINRSTIVRTNK